MAGNEFNLRVAHALMAEIRENYDNILQAAQDQSDASEDAGFLAQVKAGAAEGRAIETLHGNLNLSIQLCEALEPGVTMPHPENPDVKINAQSVISSALFCKGMIELGRGETPKALGFMEKSLEVEPDQSTLYNIGLIFLQLREERGDRGIGKLLGRGLTKMVTSGAEQLEQAVDAFRKCVEMDTKTDIAVQAGMELARLGQM